MIDQVLNFVVEYGHFVVIGLAVLAYIWYWRGIIHFRNNPPWKTGKDLRGDQQDVLAKLNEAERKVRGKLK